MTEQKKTTTPKQLAKRIEDACEELQAIRATVAPDGELPHESLYALVKNADRGLATADVAKYIADLKDED